MGLINYTQIEDGTDANSNTINSRFAQVIAQINGNLDSTNLANDAVTSAKIAPGAVTSDKLDTDRYVDDNGWEVTDLGTGKTYLYKYQITNKTIQNGTRADTATGGMPVIQPPVGRTRDNILLNPSWFGGYSGHAIPGVEPAGDTGIGVMLANQYTGSGLGASLVFNGWIYISAQDLL